MNKKLLRSVREYKKQSVLAPVLVILEVLMEVLIPLEMAKIIDVGIANGDMSYIIQRGVILVAMAMLSLFFGRTGRKYGGSCSSRIWRKNLQTRYFLLRCRTFFSKISITFQPQVWSHD